MKLICVKTFNIGNATFLDDSKYEVNLCTFMEGNLFLIDDREFTEDLHTIKFYKIKNFL